MSTTIKQTFLISIAMAAHAINRAYCESMGDSSVPAWADAPEAQQNSIISGVQMHLDNPDATPEQSHESWLALKTAEGWTYGEVKDVEAKQHPCVLPYAQLPAEQKAKDYIFRAVVHSILPIINNRMTECVAEALQNFKATVTKAPAAVASAPVAPNMVAVEYIGSRDVWVDRVYHTGLEFVTGQVRALPPSIAKNLLRHADLFKEAEPAPAEEETPPQDDTQALLDAGKRNKDEREDRREELNVIDLVNTMDKEAVAAYAQSHYGLKINRSKSVENMRTELAAHISQVGTK